MDPRIRDFRSYGWKQLGQTACGAAVWTVADGTHSLPEPKGGDTPEIFYFNDTHGGIDRLLPALKRVVPTVLGSGSSSEWVVISGGDDHGGGSPWDVSLFKESKPSLAYEMMEAAPVDIGIPGNHDLDWGWETYSKICDASPGIRRVLSNLNPDSLALSGHYPVLVIEFKEHLMAVLGLLCLDQVREAHRHLVDPEAIIGEMVTSLSALTDSVVVVSHLGYRSRTGAYCDQDLLSNTDASVLVLGSHTHDVIPSTGAWHAGRYLQCGQKGRFLGRVRQETSGWRIRVEGIAERRMDPPSQWDHKLDQLCREAGVCEIPKHPFESERPSSDGYRGECATINAATDLLLERFGESPETIVGLCVRFFSQIPLAGSMLLKDWYGSFGYADELCSMRIPLPHLPALLRLNAQRMGKPTHYMESMGFLHFSRNLRYRVVPKGRRLDVMDIQLNGKPIEDLEAAMSEVVLLTQAYVAEGMGGYARVFAGSGFPWSRQSIRYEGSSIRDCLWRAFFQKGAPQRTGYLMRDGRLDYAESSEGSGSSGSIH